ncbi:MAG: hypothetical protein EXR35_10805 [Limnohabitans sp.]|nr:hypothetical protein [Limnohabitans sp.]
MNHKIFFYIMVLLFGLMTTQIHAEVRPYKFKCQLNGTIPELEDKPLKPAQVKVEIRTIGANIFLTIQGPQPYDMYISTLATEKFTGKNLTGSSSMGIKSKDIETGYEREVRIARDSLVLSGSTDILYRKQKVKAVFEGDCLRDS